MKKTLIAIAIATLSTAALAEGGHDGGAGGQGGNGPQSNSSSISSSSSYAATSSNAYQGQVQGQGQYQTADNAGNAQNITINYPSADTRGRAGDPEVIQSRSQVEYSGSYTLKNVPAVTAPNLTTTLTETCMGSSSVGGAGAGFGFSFGTTWRDTACVRRLDARQVHALGDAQAAKEVMCESESVKAAFARVGRPCAGDAPATSAGSIVSQPTPVAAAPIKQDAEIANETKDSYFNLAFH